jgi:EthD domain
MSSERTPDLTLVLPLRKKESVTIEEFYDYWLNAHVTLPARFPGISSIWLHAVSFDNSLFPEIAGVSHQPPAEEAFHGVPEAVFPTMDDLAVFQQHAGVQMEDGINFLADMLGYASIGSHSATVVDKLGNPAPDGSDDLVRHLVFLRIRDGIPVPDFRAYVSETLVPSWSRSPHVLKLRRHLFEELDMTLDHPGVTMFKPLELQYQAAIEIVVPEQTAMTAFFESPAWTDTIESLAEHCSAVHAARVNRCITTKYNGAITLVGVRGVLIADLIRRLDAKSQTMDEVSNLFLPAPLG